MPIPTPLQKKELIQTEAVKSEAQDSAVEARAEVEIGAETAAVSAPAEQAAAVQPTVQPAAVPVTQQAVTSKSEELQKIENILAEDLEPLFKELPANRQQEFKLKGEETATQIEKILSAVKFHANKIIALIRAWLTMIPGVNKFFIEQETKIKVDKLLEYKEEKEPKI